MLGTVFALMIFISLALVLTFFIFAIIKVAYPKISDNDASNLFAKSLLWLFIFAIFASSAMFFDLGKEIHYDVECSDNSYYVYKVNGFSEYYLTETDEKIYFHGSDCVFIEVKEQ